MRTNEQFYSDNSEGMCFKKFQEKILHKNSFSKMELLEEKSLVLNELSQENQV